MSTTLTCKIETRDAALTIIKDAAYCFFGLAGLILVLGVPGDYRMLSDVIVLAVCALCLRRFNSRTAALILLAGISLPFLWTLGTHPFDVIGILLAAFFMWLAVRAVEASFKLHGRFSTPAQSGTTPMAASCAGGGFKV
jgi:hypothetical protein